MLALLLSAAVSAAPPAPGQKIEAVRIEKAMWSALPRPRDFMAVYPAEARKGKLAGEVELRCGVKADGGLSGCRLSKEQPAGQGFGEAGLKLADKFRLRTKLPDGRPVAGGNVVIPLKFHP
ncbi:TonB family protein [uncultured Caulobacter sp.]|uniref:TonB family protein n=1 Tax=uncultured Caulobacter sp. TaxID=158749 RepID=UPI0026299ECA|nr:TonB family protein [uncultured Caulobacter sp.]